MSELGNSLTCGKALLDGDQGAGDLAALVGVSIPTIKRYIAELRRLGCVIVSVRKQGSFWYRLENAPECRRLLLIWWELEAKRDLLDRQLALC